MNGKAEIVERLLDVMENDIIPMTAKGVSEGSKVFGAAILKKSDLSLVLAETNNERENPLWHGEVHCLKRFYEKPADERPDTRDCLFFATHEPCSLCLSAITWTGFDNFYYLFSHEDSRDAFNIPHDLKILKEVFNCEPGGYNRENAYWKSHSLPALAAEMDPTERARLQARIKAISDRYNGLSETYQSGKGEADIPLS